MLATEKNLLFLLDLFHLPGPLLTLWICYMQILVSVLVLNSMSF